MAFQHGGAASSASLKGDITSYELFFCLFFCLDVHICINAQAQTPTIS